MNIRRMTAGWTEPGPTAVLEHGANPGLISHWTKQGLIDIGHKLLDDKKVKPGRRRGNPATGRHDRTFNRLAMKLGVKVIHCSERDTQITDQPKAGRRVRQHLEHRGLPRGRHHHGRDGLGNARKGTAPAGLRSIRDGPRNQICLARMGINTWVRSWVPVLLHPRHGHPPRRGVYDLRPAHRLGGRPGDLPAHGPLRLLPCDCAIVSLEELRGRDYELQPKLRIMSDEIIGGADILGAC